MNIDNFNAITFTYYNMSIEKVLQYIIEKFKEKIITKEATVEPDKITTDMFLLNSCWKNPEYENHKQLEAFFYNPKNMDKKTVMVTNALDGWSTLSRIIGNYFGCEYIKVRLDDELIPEPMNSFIYARDNEERVVYSIKEGRKWTFYSTGKPVFFENMDYYKKIRINKRMNRSILIEYCNNIGLDILSDSFWEIKDGTTSIYLKSNQTD